MDFDLESPSQPQIKRFVRGSCLISLILISGFIGQSYFTQADGIQSTAAKQAKLPMDERTTIAPERQHITVITGQGFVPPGGFGKNQWADNALIALTPDGRVLYYEAKYPVYQDVDPSPEGKYTVTFVASEVLNATECGAAVSCQKDYVIQVNLTTGAREVIYQFTAPERVNNKLHDVDRIDEHRLLVAGMAYDRVYIVNTTTGIIEWQWSVQRDYNFSSGGEYPEDWTHINDVEFIPEKGDSGWIMASLRNQDQVVFIDRQTGVIENWTLGCEDCYDILYEQHNPDYIPKKNGGPAILVADSHNNNIVEYQRKNESWVQAWTWTDSNLRWPRDADRLPNGHTLITDSNGQRLLEINQAGEIVWKISIGSIYEAERLGTGDESSNGSTATRLDLQSRTNTENDIKSFATGNNPGKNLIPMKIKAAVAFVVPGWMGFWDVGLLIGALAIAGFWVSIEVYWSPWRVNIQPPIQIYQKK